MNQPPSPNNPEKSAADHPFFLPHYDSYGDYYSEITENEHDDPDKESEKDNGDLDSFGDLILFI